MPKSPWRCSQCGTVNEPASNSCRTCGRWPSLFDLQDSAVGEAPSPADEPEYGIEPRAVGRYEVESYEPEAVDGMGGDVAPVPVEQPSPTRSARSTGGRSRSPAQRLARLVIPIGIVVYFLISSYFSNH